MLPPFSFRVSRFFSDSEMFPVTCAACGTLLLTVFLPSVLPLSSSLLSVLDSRTQP